MKTLSSFTRYQLFLVCLLAVSQFTVVLDFMVLAPLGAILMPELQISTTQFGWIVSAYAFSAGASGLMVAGLADRFDRKQLLLFFYSGFIGGTALCALAHSFEQLLLARIVAGLFGGVISSISFAIITDVFAYEKRGRVMGYVQMSFAASQVMGIPVGLYLADQIHWHASFWAIVALATVALASIIAVMRPVNAHLHTGYKPQNMIATLRHILTQKNYLIGFSGTVLLATGGFMLMPFGSAFATGNMGISVEELPLLYAITGLFTFFMGPLFGRISDQTGKFITFAAGTFLAIIMVIIYTHLGTTPLWLAIALNVLLFMGVTARIVSASALTSAVPAMEDRGAFMSINASIQQISGGIASAVAGWIVLQTESGLLLHYDWLGYVVCLSMLLCLWLMRKVDAMVQKNRRVEAHP